MVKEIAGAEFTTVHSYWVYCDDVICPDRMSRYIYGSLMKSASMFLFRQWRHVPSDVTEIFGTKSVRFFGPHTRSIYSVGPPHYSFHHIFLTPRFKVQKPKPKQIQKTKNRNSPEFLISGIWRPLWLCKKTNPQFRPIWWAVANPFDDYLQRCLFIAWLTQR